MKILKILVIYFAFINYSYSQVFIDTLYSGKTLNKNFNSINKELIEKSKDFNFCEKNKESQTNKFESIKSFVPYILRNIYDKKKRDVILNFDAVIYSHFCNTGDFMYETIFMEIFYENDKLAQKCIESLEEYVKIIEYEKKNDLVAHVGELNWFFIREKNVVYFIHKRLEDNKDNPVVQSMKEIVIQLIND